MSTLDLVCSAACSVGTYDPENAAIAHRDPVHFHSSGGSHHEMVQGAPRPAGGVPHAKNQARMKTIFLRTRQE
jgi:hypothetical protein